MKDIKTIIAQSTVEDVDGLSPNHRAIFEKKLQHIKPLKPKPGYSWKAIAFVLVFFGLGVVKLVMPLTSDSSVVSSTDEASSIVTLGDLSPAFKKIETFYLASIQQQLNMIDVSSDHELVVSYMSRLDVLNKDYELLTNELNTYGPNEAYINALIDNLKLRLELLFKLKSKLKALKLE